jgi:hypothetical protein
MLRESPSTKVIGEAKIQGIFYSFRWILTTPAFSDFAISMEPTIDPLSVTNFSPNIPRYEIDFSSPLLNLRLSLDYLAKLFDNFERCFRILKNIISPRNRKLERKTRPLKE